MSEQLVTAALAGPLLALALYELLGVRRLFSGETVKVFLWGLAFALVAFPALAFLDAVPVKPDRDLLIELGGRMVRIWLIVFGLALFGRMGIAAARWLWKKRPRPVRYEPGRERDTTR
jgi:hypothetical protein